VKDGAEIGGLFYDRATSYVGNNGPNDFPEFKRVSDTFTD